MLLSFQRPSHLFRKVPPSRQARPGNRLPAPERTDEYSAESGRGTSLRKIFPGRANHVREARKPRSTGADSVAEIGSG
jgi:hypothetical protein